MKHLLLKALVPFTTSHTIYKAVDLLLPETMHPPNNPPRIKLNLRWEGLMYNLQMPTSATVLQLMHAISQIEGIPVPANRQNLHCANALLPELSGLQHHMTLEQCGIPNDCLVDVIRMLQLRVVSEGRAWLQMFNEDSTVATVKASFGPAAEDMALQMTYNGQHVLVDDRAYLWAAGIKDGDTVSLVAPPPPPP